MSSLTDFFQYYKFCSWIAAILKFEPNVTIQKYLVVKSKISKNRILWWRPSRPPPRAKAKIDQLIKMCDDTSMHKSKVLNIYLGMGEGEIFFLQYQKLKFQYVKNLLEKFRFFFVCSVCM